MSGYDELIASEMWSNPALARLLESATVDANRKPITAADLDAGSLGPVVLEWSDCGDCGKWITEGDLCGHCERKHVRRVVERYGDESAGVCGACATDAALTAGRTGGDVGHLYDDVLRRKAGLPARCEPEKAGALDVELCDEPVKPADPVWQLPDNPLDASAWKITEADLTYEPPLRDELEASIAAAMLRHPAGSMLDTSKWTVGRMPAGPVHIGPEDSLSDLGMIVRRHTPGDGQLTPLNDDVEAELVAIRRTQAWVTDLLAQPHGPAVQVVVDVLSKRLDQLEAAALAKRGNQ